MEIITRKEAKELGLKRYFTGLPCKHGHITERRTANRECWGCRLSYGSDYKKKKYKENTKKFLDIKKQYYRDNKDSVGKYKKEWYQKNKEAILEKRKNYYEENKEIITVNNLIWKNNNKDKMRKWMNEYHKERNKTPKQKLINFCRKSLRRILDIIKQNKNFSLSSNMPYTIQELKEHIEKQFTKGMSWESDIHIDHIKPLSYLVEIHKDKTQKEILFIVNALSNLQPLWAIDNMKKGSRI